MDNPIFSYTILGLWTIFWIYNLYSKIQYRLGKVDYILFPTQNDQYSKMTYLTLGLMVIGFATASVIWFKPSNYHILITFAVGSIVFFNGVFDLPKGKMKITGNQIKMSGLKDKIDKRQLKEISISPERIILTTINDGIQRVGNLDIDKVSAKLICNYISENSNDATFKVVNEVS